MTYFLTLQCPGRRTYKTVRVRGTKVQAVNLAATFVQREPNLTVRVYRFVRSRNIERLVRTFEGRSA